MERKLIFEALSICRFLHLSPDRGFILECASALWKERRFFKRLRLRRALSEDLRSWVFVDPRTARVVCPNSYLEDRPRFGEEFHQFLELFLKRTLSKSSEERIAIFVSALRRLSTTTGDFRFSCEMLEDMTRTQGNNAVVWRALSLVYNQLHKNREAVAAARRAVEIDSHPVSYAVLGYAHTRAGSESDALKAALEAVRVAPTSDFAWLNLGVLLSKGGSSQSAIAALSKACAFGPSNAKAWVSLGIAKERAGDLRGAVEACKKAVEVGPLNAEAWHTLGISLHKQGELDSAIATLERAATLNAEDTSITVSLSRVYFSIGNTESAVAVISRALELTRPGDNIRRAYLLYILSVGLGKAGMHRESLEAASEALKLNPSAEKPKLTVAFNLLGLPDEQERIQFAIDFAQWDETEFGWYQLNRAYAKAGRFEEALDAAQLALKVNPQYIPAVRAVAYNLCALRREEEAMNFLSVRSTLLSAEDWHTISERCRLFGLPIVGIYAAEWAATLEPQGISHWTLLARHQCDCGDYTGALEALENIADLESEFRRRAKSLTGKETPQLLLVDDCLEATEMSLRKMEFLEITGSTRDAFVLACQFLQVDPACKRAWNCMALCYARLSDPPDEPSISKLVGKSAASQSVAFGTAQQFVDLAPGLAVEILEGLVSIRRLLVIPKAELLNLLSISRRKCRDLTGARSAALMAVEQEPLRPDFWYTLGRANEAVFAYLDAREAYSRAIRLNPGYRGAQARLDIVLDELLQDELPSVRLATGEMATTGLQSAL